MRSNYFSPKFDSVLCHRQIIKKFLAFMIKKKKIDTPRNNLPKTRCGKKYICPSILNLKSFYFLRPKYYWTRHINGFKFKKQKVSSPSLVYIKAWESVTETECDRIQVILAPRFLWSSPKQSGINLSRISFLALWKANKKLNSWTNSAPLIEGKYREIQ